MHQKQKNELLHTAQFIKHNHYYHYYCSIKKCANGQSFQSINWCVVTTDLIFF